MTLLYVMRSSFLYRVIRRPMFLLAGLVLLSVVSASAAANTVSTSATTDQSFPVTANQVKPPECASLNLDSIVVSGLPSSGGSLVLGTSGDDYLRGGGGTDCIVAGAGDDFVRGGNSADVILGGDGNDTLIGGNGGDWILGEAGDDWINGRNGTDLCEGGPGTDIFVRCETEIP